ncbi:MAG: glucan biosynthesis protein [Parvibaculaceae bacterium]
MMNRRDLLGTGVAAAAFAAFGLPADAVVTGGLKLGSERRFSYEALIETARGLAGKPYAAPAAPPRDVLERIDYQAHGQIAFDTGRALFADGPGSYPVTFFPLGKYFQLPVRMHVVSGGASSQVEREIIYDPAYFSMPADSPARALPKDCGFAGFRLQESRFGDQAKLGWRRNDWAAFLGASYFRAIGELQQYGLSARGIAVDTALADRPEEFPSFTHFYFETPDHDGDAVVLYALLDGPSLAGAYRFALTRGKGVVMEIEKALFLRKDVARFGIAPMTSMFWFSETRKSEAVDWRPEVHDSDGLAMWTGAGERIWRPLNNPRRIIDSSFKDRDPRGFGLLQRDRAFDHYQDGVLYDRRPSLWVEPLDGWGAGAVQLMELPTDDEIHDNIVAAWVPAEPAAAGSSLRFRYRLHWLADEPYPMALARCVATRLGNGGQPGLPRPQGVRKFMIEFQGGPLAGLPFGVKPEPVLWSSRGSFSYVFTEAVPDGLLGHWRAQFDLTVAGTEPVEMRLFLRNGQQVLSETWLYQYHPFPSAQS